MRIALNSWGNINTGIGSEARWLWNMLPFDVWLQARHPKLGYGRDILEEHGRLVSRDWATNEMLDFDVLMCIERPLPEWLPNNTEAKLVVLVNPEWLHSSTRWLPYADLLIGRTNHCMDHLQLSLGLRNIAFARVPIDLSEFPFKERDTTDRFVFSNGWGGVHLRKGITEVREILALRPGSITVYSQRHFKDVLHFDETENASDIYSTADVMVVPSRFEGVGLTILEAMASGCLVMATDAPPMNEFLYSAYGEDADYLLLPVRETATVNVGGQGWPCHFVDPSGAVDVMERLQRQPSGLIRDLSLRGRAYIDLAHGQDAAARLWEAITNV